MARPSPPTADRRDTERQLSVLFGESLVGPWPEVAPGLEPRGKIRRRRAWPRWLAAAAALAIAGVIGARILVRPALEHRATGQRLEQTERVRLALQDGHVEHVAKLLADLDVADAPLDPADPSFEDLLRAEAAVYRYSDARPERRARIWPHLSDAAAAARSAKRLLARFTVLSRAERAERMPELERLRVELPSSPEVHYLIASVREATGDVAGAREAYRRSEALGPAWLAHRFEQLEFERLRGTPEAAVEVARGMLAVSPGSPWAREAATETALPVPPRGADPVEPATIPVQLFRAHLEAAARPGDPKDRAKAERSLAAAVAAVHGEPPFLLDAFDYLRQRGADALARRLTELPEWPADSPTARAQARTLPKGPTAR